MDQFKKIFQGLQRAHGCTYVDKKGADGLKIKGKSFVKREIVTDLTATLLIPQFTHIATIYQSNQTFPDI